MKLLRWIPAALCLAVAGPAVAREAKVVRSPSYHEGRVAFSYLGDIWTAREDGSGVVRLTVNKARDLNPRFSPDGRSIAFSSDREGGLDVFLIPGAGGEVKRLTRHSADGKRLAFVSDKSGREEIYVIDPDGSGEAKKLTDVDALKSGHAWSPDSKTIAFTASDGKLRTVTSAGGDLKVLAESKFGNIGRPAWSPDGKTRPSASPT